jgi:hypothetical protein
MAFATDMIYLEKLEPAEACPWRVNTSRPQLLPFVNPRGAWCMKVANPYPWRGVYRSLHAEKLLNSIITSAKTPQNKNLLLIHTVTVDLYSGCAILESIDNAQPTTKDES